MQKSIFQKTALTVIILMALTVCFCILSKAGIQPLPAAIIIVCLKGFIRFVYRTILMLVSIAAAIFLFITLLTCI